MLLSRHADCVLVGDRQDPHLAAVADEMVRRRVAAMIIDAAALDGGSYVLNDTALVFRSETTLHRTLTLDLEATVPGWIRRLAPPQWRPGTTASTRESVIRAAWLDLLEAILQAARVRWLTPIDRLTAAENKVFQYTTARRIGIPVPPFCITNDIAEATTTPPLIAKPLGPADYIDSSGNPKVAFTAEVPDPSSSWRGWDALSEAPFILQQRRVPPKCRDVRFMSIGCRVG
jgi:hypothetical protein